MHKNTTADLLYVIRIYLIKGIVCSTFCILVHLKMADLNFREDDSNLKLKPICITKKLKFVYQLSLNIKFAS